MTDVFKDGFSRHIKALEASYSSYTRYVLTDSISDPLATPGDSTASPPDSAATKPRSSIAKTGLFNNTVM